MDKFLNKLSEYHFIQSLVSGMIFTYCSKMFYEVNFFTDKPVYDFIVILIIGLVISRVGSVIVEPILKKTRIINFCNYSDYIEASQKDAFIKELSETNNLYREIIASFFMLLVEKGYLLLRDKFTWIDDRSYLIISILLILLFVLSYRKQTKYIKHRIGKILKQKDIEQGSHTEILDNTTEKAMPPKDPPNNQISTKTPKGATE